MRKISISYMPENPVAKPFYASFGFVEAGHRRGRRDDRGARAVTAAAPSILGWQRDMAALGYARPAARPSPDRARG